MTLDTVVMIINDIIRLTLFDSRPFWDEKTGVFPCVCEYTPSNPSPTATNSLLFFSLFLFVRNEIKLKNRLENKNTNFFSTKHYVDENESNLSQIRIQIETHNNISLICLSIFLIYL